MRLELDRHLVAMDQMRGGSQGIFESLGGDPWLVFKPEAPLPPGWYHMRLAAELPNGSVPRVYLDFGHGFQESLSCALWSRAGRLEALMLVPEPLQLIRLDPTDMPGPLAIRGFEARRITEAEYLLRRSRDVGWKGVVSRVASYLTGRRPRIISVEGAFAAATPSSRVESPKSYPAWISRYDYDDKRDRAVLSARVDALTHAPLISVVMPVYNTPPKLLDQAIQSVVDQVYPHWELCIANDASPKAHVRPQLYRWAARDRRIKVVHRSQNGHICHATNSAFSLAGGEWVALLDHDDVLRPHALAEAALALSVHPDAALIYSDEDKIDEKGLRYDPNFKPDFSPELFHSMNYLNHLTLHRADLVRAVGGWRPGFEGSQDYDISLRIIEKIDPRNIVHIPKVLYHWRAVEGSTALAVSEKNYTYKAGFRALEEHLERTGQKARVLQVPSVPFYRIQNEIGEPAPLVTLIIPTRDRVDLLKTAISSILEKTTYQNYEIIVMNNNSEKAETFAYFDEISRRDNVRVITYPHAFNFSAINNEAVRHANGEIVGLINNDIEVITPDWLTEMVSWSQLDRVGCVGAKLYYPNDTLQHGGIILGIGGVAGHSHKQFRRSDVGYFSRLMVQQNLSAVTAACLLVRRSIYDQVGGLDEDGLRVAFNDVDFCLKVRDAGYDNVWTPFAELYHHESPSRGHEDTSEKQARFASEVRVMQGRWGDKLRCDPYYSTNLTLDREDFSIRD